MGICWSLLSDKCSVGLLFLPFEELIPDNTEMDASLGGLSPAVVDVTSSPLPVNVITRVWEGGCRAVLM